MRIVQSAHTFGAADLENGVYHLFDGDFGIPGQGGVEPARLPAIAFLNLMFEMMPIASSTGGSMRR